MSRRTSEVTSVGRLVGRLIRRFRRSKGGTAAIEFAFIMPLLAALTFGLIETAMAMLEFNRAGEATRRAMRAAIINDPIGTLDNLTTSDVVCSSSGGGVTCTGGSVAAAATFTAIVASMQVILPTIQAGNVRVTYRISGIDDAATPGVVTPTVSISVVGLTHTFLVIGAFPGMPSEITFPAFTTSALAPSVVL